MAKIDLKNYGPGRPQKPETIELMNRMLDRIKKEPGVPSAKLAKDLGITSNLCAKLAIRLRTKGAIVIEKSQTEKALTYRLAA